MNFQNKKALITGATGGIGKELSINLVNQGVDVCLTGTNLNKLRLLKKKLSSLTNNVKIIIYPCDLSKEKIINNLIKFINKNFSHLDYLFNNAGIFNPKKINKENNKNLKNFY